MLWSHVLINWPLTFLAHTIRIAKKSRFYQRLGFFRSDSPYGQTEEDLLTSWVLPSPNTLDPLCAPQPGAEQWKMSLSCAEPPVGTLLAAYSSEEPLVPVTRLTNRRGLTSTCEGFFFFFGATAALAFKSFMKNSLKPCQVAVLTQLVAENTYLSPGLSQHTNQMDEGRVLLGGLTIWRFLDNFIFMLSFARLMWSSRHKGNLHTEGFLCAVWALSTY